MYQGCSKLLIKIPGGKYFISTKNKQHGKCTYVSEFWYTHTMCMLEVYIFVYKFCKRTTGCKHTHRRDKVYYQRVPLSESESNKFNVNDELSSDEDILT